MLSTVAGALIVRVDPLSITRSEFATVAPAMLFAILSPMVSVLTPPDETNVTLIFPVIHNCASVPGRNGKVTVGEPDAALNIARSALPGTDAPGAPPDVNDQFVVLVQTPVPPDTQYRGAAKELKANKFKINTNNKYLNMPVRFNFELAFFLIASQLMPGITA
jgi:hypothetical protein